MKNLIIIIALLFSVNALSITVEIMDPCEHKSRAKGQIEILNPASVHEIVNFLFPTFDFSYELTQTSMIQIFNTPTDASSVEYVSSTNIRYYGWCYEVDGVMPDVTMDRFTVDPMIHEQIRWFYGYAELNDGNWVHYCEPLYNHPGQFICPGQIN